MQTLRQQVDDVIRSWPGLSAREIADELGCNARVVYQILQEHPYPHRVTCVGRKKPTRLYFPSVEAAKAWSPT